MSMRFDNKLTITNDDPKMIERIIKAYERTELFHEFVPCPQELRAIDDHVESKKTDQCLTKMNKRYDWCIDHWGAPKDAGREEYTTLSVINPTKIKLVFFTFYDAPLPIFDFWVDLGCQVRGIIGGDYDPVEKYENKKLWRRIGRAWKRVCYSVDANELRKERLKRKKQTDDLLCKSDALFYKSTFSGFN